MAYPTPERATAEKELRNFRRAFEDNERVWFHPDKGLLAVWYGGATVSIFNADTFEEVDMFTQSMAFTEHEIEELEAAIDVRLAQDGFMRDGRGAAEKAATVVTKR